MIALLLTLPFAAPSGAQIYKTPRTSWGAPDLEGAWTNTSLTKLTRSPGSPLVVSEAEAKRMAATATAARDADLRPSDPHAGPLAVGAGGSGLDYNAYWLDPGRTLAKVNGVYRASWLVDPSDGQLPLSEAGKALVASAAAFRRAADRPTDPEALEPWDRCLIASRGSGGPGLLNNIVNSNYQIVETAGAVAIMAEMIHDVRIIPLYPSRTAALAARPTANSPRWLGDSRGWWEGDTLVVDTTQVNPEQGRVGPIYLTPQGHITERFTRVADKAILYEFTVEDSVYYTRPWRAEMTLMALDSPIYEYACHEGNSALWHMLAAARGSEARRPR